MAKDRTNIVFEHNQRLGEVFICAKHSISAHINDCIVWVCELTGDYLLAEFGENIPRITIDKAVRIQQTSDNTYYLHK